MIWQLHKIALAAHKYNLVELDHQSTRPDRKIYHHRNTGYLTLKNTDLTTAMYNWDLVVEMVEMEEVEVKELGGSIDIYTQQKLLNLVHMRS
jgi:hypothetical protein